MSLVPILLGTSSFTASGWEGSFYPKGIRSSDYLSYYAEHFQTVEVDSTFYACPSAQTVTNWAARTPEGFIFSVKIPQVITHEKVLANCEADLNQFVETMHLLDEKLGPIVLQFPLFSRFASLLRDQGIALVLQDRSWMPSPSDLKFDPITAEWTYIRWLGDRRAIEAQTTTWDKTIVDRTAELTSCVDFCCQLRKRGVVVYAYANNHFSGHGPATIHQFRNIWMDKGYPALPGPKPSPRQPSLFPA